MNFNLQNANFSSGEDDDDDLFVPSAQLISEYNREYSLIVKEIQGFLKECKESVQRFVAFNNFGINFNLSHLLQSLVGAEIAFKNKVSSPQTTKTKADPKKQIKHKFQITFNKIIKRMGDILKDFIDCEIQFKKEYFGIKLLQSNQPHKKEMITSPRNHLNSFSVSSLTHSSTSSRFKFQNILENEDKQEKRQAQLRKTLKQKLKPSIHRIEIECKQQYSTTQNLYRLNEKMDKIVSDMKFVKNRQDKLIELFNINRIKKIHQNYPEEQEPDKDGLGLNMTTSSIESYSHIHRQTSNQDHDDVDQFLDNCRSIRKDSDQFLPNPHPRAYEKSTFIKKVKSINMKLPA